MPKTGDPPRLMELLPHSLPLLCSLLELLPHPQVALPFLPSWQILFLLLSFDRGPSATPPNGGKVGPQHVPEVW